MELCRTPLGDKSPNANLPSLPGTSSDAAKLRRRAAMRIPPRHNPRASGCAYSDAEYRHGIAPVPALAPADAGILGPVPGLNSFSASFALSELELQWNHSHGRRISSLSFRTLSTVTSFQAVSGPSSPLPSPSSHAISASRRSFSSIASTPRSPIRISRNPYEPWPASVRSRVLTSALTATSRSILAAHRRRRSSMASNVSRYSRPYSRSGARAPEPTQSCVVVSGQGIAPREVQSPSPVPRSRRRGVVGIVKYSLHGVASSIRRLRLKTRTARMFCFSGSRPASVCTNLTFSSSNVPSELRSSLINSPIPLPSLRNSFSESWVDSLSIRSAGSSALEIWLENRRRSLQQFEAEAEGKGALMNLEEYERRGSWVANARATQGPSGTQWLCGIPECGTHEHRTASPPAHWET